MSTKFGDALFAVRKISDLTQDELGKRAGVPATSIAHFESGRRQPSIESIVRLAAALHVSTDHLLGVLTRETLEKHESALKSRFQDDLHKLGIMHEVAEAIAYPGFDWLTVLQECKNTLDELYAIRYGRYGR